MADTNATNTTNQESADQQDILRNDEISDNVKEAVKREDEAQEG